MASLLQLTVPLCVVLTLISLAPVLGLIAGIPVLLGTLATVTYVYSEAKHQHSVLLGKRIRVFLHFTVLSGAMGMSFPLFGFCAGSVVGGLVGAGIGCVIGMLVVVVMLRNATGVFPA